MSANRAWISCWYLGMDQNNTGRGKVVKCSRHTNNTYFVVSTARGLKKKNQRGVAVQAVASFCSVENVCLDLFLQRRPFGWMSLTDELFLDNTHTQTQCENRKSEEEKNKGQKIKKKQCREMANEMRRRGEEWLSLVQVNERWKHKEAVWGCGGLNRKDWQKQSSSTVGCLNLHRCCYTPSTPHQSSLMISNITQSFVIALELNQHGSPWLTFLSFNCLEIHILGRNVIQSQLGLVRGEGLSFWLNPSRWQQNI